MKSPTAIMSSSGVSASAPKKSRAKPTHPRTADMVNGAIGALKERGGSSLQAIKKYMSSTYKIDADKQSPFIKRYLKTAVAGGDLVQTKGKGAAGSFKLSGSREAKKRPVVLKNTPLKKAVNTSSIPKKTTVKKSVVKRAPVKTVAERKKIIKGPAAKPPKAKISAKVKAATKAPKKGIKKVGKVVKAKKPVKKTSGRKK